MGKPPSRRATYEDLRAVPDPLVAELVGGELFASPRPASPHAQAHSYLLGDLIAAFGDSGGGAPPGGGWWFLTEPELHLGEDVLVPDVAAWRRERMPVIPNVAAFSLAPDWVCEVISPSTARLDRALKLPSYARASLAHVWLVDPLARTLEVYRLAEEGWLLLDTFEGDAVVRAEPFEAVALSLSRWWLREARVAP